VAYFEYVLLALVLLLPVLSVSFPSLVDYPDHLARAYVLVHHQDVALYRQAIQVNMSMLPNVAVDVVIPPLLRFMSLRAAGTTFLVALAGLYFLGCYILASAIHGRGSLAPFVAFTFLYNSSFLYGFVNNMAGLAVFLLSFGLWLRWRGPCTVGKLAVVCLLAAASFFAHLSSVAFLGLSIVVCSLIQILQTRTVRAVSLADFAPILVHGVLFLNRAKGAGSDQGIYWNTIKGKVIALLVVSRGYSLRLDLLLAALLLIVCVAALYRSRELVLFREPAATALALFLCFILFPKGMFGGEPVDARFVLPAAIVASLSFSAILPPRKTAFFLGCIVALQLGRTLDIWRVWRANETQLDEAFALMSCIPERSTVYGLQEEASGSADSVKRQMFLRKAVDFAVPRRSALVMPLASGKGIEPISLVGTYATAGWKPRSAKPWPEGYQYVWTFDATDSVRRRLEQTGHFVARRGPFALWRRADSAAARLPAEECPRSTPLAAGDAPSLLITRGAR